MASTKTSVALDPNPERRESIYALSTSSSCSNLADLCNPEILPNRLDEPEFQLKVEPNSQILFKIDLNSDLPSLFNITLYNLTDHLHTFKIKTNLSEKLRAKPPIGLIPPQSNFSVQLSHHSKEFPRTFHFLAIYHSAISEEETEKLKEFWKRKVDYDGVRRIAVGYEMNLEE